VTSDLQAGTGVSRLGPTAGILAQFIVLGVLAATIGLHATGWVAGTAFAVVTWAAVTRALNRSGMRGLGPANAVTLARATLVGGVTALVADATALFADATAAVAHAVRGAMSDTVAGAASAALPTPDPVIPSGSLAVLVGVAAVALVLDAVDGQVARRTGSSTPLGARFDMETDAFLILVLSVFVASSLGWWVLAIGALRYFFVAAAWALAWLKGPLPPRFSRKTVAAVQGIVLVVASAGVLPTPLAIAVVGTSLALLIWSFARDIHWLWTVRPAALDREAAPLRAI
jgi:phosphatidylglycerophosphate synthase